MTTEKLLEETILPNSYRNFHAKGFDYLCLKRTPELTLKAYFFEGDVSKLPEVVMPHDHRYAFQTYCLSGAVRNWGFESPDGGRDYECASRMDAFAYLTPLNGGDGFTWIAEVELAKFADCYRSRGGSYRLERDDLHTIQIAADQTVLLLAQFADEIGPDVPTFAYKPVGGPKEVSLDGLYDRMDADHALMRLRQVRELMGVSEDAN